MTHTYADGRLVRVGDIVRYAQDGEGTVVADLDAGSHTEGFPIDEWRYLQSGVLVSLARQGIVHFPATDDGDLTLVARAR